MTNIGSITKVEITDGRYITVSERDQDNTVIASTGIGFETLPVQAGSASLKETEKQVNEGVIYNVQLKFTVPRISIDTEKLLNKYERIPVVFKLTDGNGQKYLLGDQNVPAYLYSDKQIPKDAAALNAYFLEVNYQNPRRLPFTA